MTKWLRQKKITLKNAPDVTKTTARAAKLDIDGKKINAKSLISDISKKIRIPNMLKLFEKGFPDDGMPAFKGKLTDEEINGVVKYIRTELQK